MRVYRTLLACIVLLAAVSGVGCRNTCSPEAMLGEIVFPNKWVGDIDTIRFNEPSGICWHTQRQTLFLVGDEGDICEIKADGALVKLKTLRQDADFEAITHDPATGLLYIGVEEEERILEVDPETFEIRREFALPRDFQGKTLLAAGGEGIEALTFVPDPRHDQGGLFYVANQSFTLSNPQDISAIFQVELPIRRSTGAPRIVGYFEPGVIDIAGLHYDPATGHILAVSDAANMLFEYSATHELLNVYAFPGDNQEGITVDPDGFIYIAQDTGGLIKLKWLR